MTWNRAPRGLALPSSSTASCARPKAAKAGASSAAVARGPRGECGPRGEMERAAESTRGAEGKRASVGEGRRYSGERSASRVARRLWAIRDGPGSYRDHRGRGVPAPGSFGSRCAPPFADLGDSGDRVPGAELPCVPMANEREKAGSDAQKTECMQVRSRPWLEDDDVSFRDDEPMAGVGEEAGELWAEVHQGGEAPAAGVCAASSRLRSPSFARSGSSSRPPLPARRTTPRDRTVRGAP